MTKRHHIREAAALLLYALYIDANKDTQDETIDSFWSLYFDRKREELNKEQAKTILHFTQDRSDKLSVFETRYQAELTRLKQADCEKLYILLESILLKEHSLNTLIHSLDLSLNSKTESMKAERNNTLAQIFEINAHLVSYRENALLEIAKLPHHAGWLNPITGALRKTQILSQRITTVQTPDSYPDNQEVKHLRNSTESMKKLMIKTNEWVDNIMAQSDAIDALIIKTVENYSPERITPLDASILRLSTYEIINQENLPLPIIVSEAILIAEKYSGTESPQFINGVLTQIYKSQTPSA